MFLAAWVLWMLGLCMGVAGFPMFAYGFLVLCCYRGV